MMNDRDLYVIADKQRCMICDRWWVQGQWVQVLSMVYGLYWRAVDWLLTATLDFGIQDLGAEPPATLDFDGTSKLGQQLHMVHLHIGILLQPTLGRSAAAMHLKIFWQATP